MWFTSKKQPTHAGSTAARGLALFAACCIGCGSTLTRVVLSGGASVAHAASWRMSACFLVLAPLALALEARWLDAASRARWLRSSLPQALAVGVVQGLAFLCSSAALAHTSFAHALCASNVVSVWLAIAAVLRWAWSRAALQQQPHERVGLGRAASEEPPIRALAAPMSGLEVAGCVAGLAGLALLVLGDGGGGGRGGVVDHAPSFVGDAFGLATSLGQALVLTASARWGGSSPPLLWVASQYLTASLVTSAAGLVAPGGEGLVSAHGWLTAIFGWLDLSHAGASALGGTLGAVLVPTLCGHGAVAWLVARKRITPLVMGLFLQLTPVAGILIGAAAGQLRAPSAACYAAGALIIVGSATASLGRNQGAEAAAAASFLFAPAAFAPQRKRRAAGFALCGLVTLIGLWLGLGLGRGAPLLPVVLVSFNPARFASHTGNVLAQQVRLAATRGVEVFTVELAYEDAPFAVTRSGDAHHLQLRWPHGVGPLWSKENLINIAAQRLLPPDWRAFAFVDAEVTFEDPLWAVRSLDALLVRREFDALQPYDTLLQCAGSLQRRSVGFYAAVGADFDPSGAAASAAARGMAVNFSAGIAWAVTRGAWERVGGLFDRAIVGGGDAVLAGALVNSTSVLGTMRQPRVSVAFRASLARYVFASNVDARPLLRTGYVQGAVSHASHGTILNRQYLTRQVDILRDYNPELHTAIDAAQGLLVPSAAMPSVTATAIRAMFAARREDDRSDVC